MKSLYLHSILFIIFILSACVSDKINPNALEERVKGCWQAKQNKEWNKSYEFYCKKYKNQISYENFIKSSNLDITGFKVEKTDFREKEKTATVTVSFDNQSHGFHFQGIKIREEWIYEENNWYVCAEAGSFKKMFEGK